MQNRKFSNDPIAGLMARMNELEARIRRQENQKINTLPLYDQPLSLKNDSLDGQVILATPAMMGMMAQPANIQGLRFMYGFAYYPKNAMKVADSDTFEVGYYNINGFDEMWVNVHRITGFRDDAVDRTRPFRSAPWIGNIGASFDIFLGSNHEVMPPMNFQFGQMFVGITDHYLDSITWNLPGGVTIPEQYAFDSSGHGHIGYAFHDFGYPGISSSGGYPTGSFTAGAPGAVSGSITTMLGKPGVSPTLGAIIGQGHNTGFPAVDVTITEDIEVGDGLLFMIATRDLLELSQLANVPTITISRNDGRARDLVPHYRFNGQWHEINSRDRLGNAFPSAFTTEARYIELTTNLVSLATGVLRDVDFSSHTISILNDLTGVKETHNPAVSFDGDNFQLITTNSVNNQLFIKTPGRYYIQSIFDTQVTATSANFQVYIEDATGFEVHAVNSADFADSSAGANKGIIVLEEADVPVAIVTRVAHNLGSTLTIQPHAGVTIVKLD